MKSASRRVRRQPCHRHFPRINETRLRHGPSTQRVTNPAAGTMRKSDEALDRQGRTRQRLADPADRLVSAHCREARCVDFCSIRSSYILFCSIQPRAARQWSSWRRLAADPRVGETPSRIFTRSPPLFWTASTWPPATSAALRSRSRGSTDLRMRLRSGRGCLLLGSHLGSFDFMLLAQRQMDGRPSQCDDACRPARTGTPHRRNR